MTKLLITPIKSKCCDIDPYEVEGDVTTRIVDGKKYWYILGQSYPDNIVKVLKEE